jgi:prolyl-tRNA editing enzyme YbaK/EbsC (Cys-tRNA(Pro) deacylase)
MTPLAPTSNDPTPNERGRHPSTERVAQALRDGGASGDVHQLADSTRTAQEAADALGVPVGAIVKSLVFTADGEPVLILASGDHQVDVGKIAGTLGAERVARAAADTVRAATGYPIGGVAPLAHPAPLRTLVDTHLAGFDVVWAAAGTPHSVFPTTYDELVRLTGGRPADVAAP